MKIAVTGSHGLIGSALMVRLRTLDHVVVPLVRGASEPGQVQWDPTAGQIDAQALDGIDAVVHLAGAGVGDHRWSPSYKAEILRSRTDGTALLATTLSQLSTPPRVLVSASAVGFYGSRGDEVLTESSGPGTGFLADVCAQWEGATTAASDAGIRVVHLRSGIVLSAAGGALKRQLLPFRMGLGVRLGHGDQFLSWVSRRDLVAAIAFLLSTDPAPGPYNLTSPNPVTNRDFTAALGAAVHRPARLVVPEAVLRLAVGREMTDEFLVASQRAVPDRLIESGFDFADQNLAAALVTALADDQRSPAA
jgi:uncharacterized protein (TIGR01777 family)